ncbi:MAG TPA: hypothetical protein VL981_08455 [Candidatus Methylacidiphilales bacterium]|nr:hypothetical protein [Candidatus Methylacidiphilales bacterium]
MKYLLRLAALWAGCSLLKAQDATPDLLLHPEKELAASIPASAPVTLAPTLDGQPVSFSNPQILLQKSSGPAEFISAVWKGSDGKPLHSREVFVVKPDYEIVVDHLYGAAGEHSIVRSFVLPAGPVSADALGVQVMLDGGKVFRVQANDTGHAELQAKPTQVGLQNISSAKTLILTSPAKLPLPISTVLASWTGSSGPKIEMVRAGNPLVVKFKVTFPNGRVDLIALAWESRLLHLDEKMPDQKAFHGWAALWQRGPAGESTVEIN